MVFYRVSSGFLIAYAYLTPLSQPCRRGLEFLYYDLLTISIIHSPRVPLAYISLSFPGVADIWLTYK
jgi:hypothetical protein